MKTTIFLAAMLIVGAVAVVPSASAADVLDLDSGGGSGCSHLPYLAELYCRAKEAVCALTCATDVITTELA